MARSNKDIFIQDEKSKSLYINTKDAFEYFERARLKDKVIDIKGQL